MNANEEKSVTFTTNEYLQAETSNCQKGNPPLSPVTLKRDKFNMQSLQTSQYTSWPEDNMESAYTLNNLHVAEFLQVTEVGEMTGR